MRFTSIRVDAPVDTLRERPPHRSTRHDSPLVRKRSLLLAGAAASLAAVGVWRGVRTSQSCDAPLEVPDGFCATVFAEDVGPARHLAVTPDGRIYVATWREGQRSGGIVVLRDTTGDGKADVRERFGPEGGSGLAISGGALYFATWSQVLRYQLDPTALVPANPPEPVVTGMPLLEHGARSIAVHGSSLYVNIGVSSNACERDYGRRDLIGAYPCRELETSGGIWRFDTRATGQRPTIATRYATGLRHVVALGVGSDGVLYGAPHGIDHLNSWWPQAGYSARDAANIPSETLFRIDSAGDYGFPYCMYDPRPGRMIVAPAYANAPVTDRCNRAVRPLATFPAHAAPMAIAVSDSGLFVALHGSLFHSPDQPRGYAVMFVDRSYRVEPFAVARRSLVGGRARPSGLALGPDGTLYVSDDYRQRVYAIRPRR
jgi:glucose/arabinose dehydrogenase